MKVGELVTYTESIDPKTKQPIEVNALVLGERFVPEHEGKDGEPLLTLVFAKQRLDPFGVPLPLHGTGNQSELIQIRADVAHQSHVYNAKQRRAFGKGQYDGGRWRAHGSPVIQPERREEKDPDYKFDGVERRGVKAAEAVAEPASDAANTNAKSTKRPWGK